MRVPTSSKARFRTAVLCTATSLFVLIPILVCAVQAAEPPDVSPAEERELAARGAVTYRVYCASCHGRKARGDGKLANLLDTEPPNLTLIAWRHEDQFPAAHVYDAIDGREVVTSEMPVWGEALGATEEAAGLEPDEIEAKIWELVYYLKSVQSQKGS